MLKEGAMRAAGLTEERKGNKVGGLFYSNPRRQQRQREREREPEREREREKRAG